MKIATLISKTTPLFSKYPNCLQCHMTFLCDLFLYYKLPACTFMDLSLSFSPTSLPVLAPENTNLYNCIIWPRCIFLTQYNVFVFHSHWKNCRQHKHTFQLYFWYLTSPITLTTRNQKSFKGMCFFVQCCITVICHWYHALANSL